MKPKKSGMIAVGGAHNARPWARDGPGAYTPESGCQGIGDLVVQVVPLMTRPQCDKYTHITHGQ